MIIVCIITTFRSDIFNEVSITLKTRLNGKLFISNSRKSIFFNIDINYVINHAIR